MSSSYSNLSGFAAYLQTYKIKEKDENRPYTNTRIGDETLNIYGGSYHVPTADYSLFLDKYHDEIVVKNKSEYLTEVQLSEGGAILVDVDLRFPFDTTQRQYTQEHIGDLVDLYVDVLQTMYQFDDDTEFNIYVCEKTTVNRVQNKQITKDGIHLIFGLHCERKAQILLRKTVLSRLGETCWSELEKGGSLGQLNAWEDVFDDGITKGDTNWQMFGSCKPNHEAYKLTHMYRVKYSDDEGGINITPVPSVKNNTSIVKTHFANLSARCATHPQYLYSSGFMAILEEYKRVEGERTASSYQSNGGAHRVRYADYLQNSDVVNATSHEELDALLQRFLDSIEPHEYILLRETYEYVMSLPSEFYENGSYSKWIRVGWALRNTDDRLFIVWVVFSAQMQSFMFSYISELHDKWQGFDLKNPQGLTKRSIMHWSKEYARPKYNAVRLNSVDYKIEQMLGKLEDLQGGGKKKDKYGCGDFDIAEVLYHLKKGEYVCVSVKSSIWYMYLEPRWVEIDSGTTLRKSLSTELRNIMANKATKFMEERSKLNDGNDADRIQTLTTYIDKLLNISQRLANTQDKKNIMTEAKELFYDGAFLQKLDNNPYLLCFNNGVVDFKEKRYRRGVPEDYLSKCTNIDYIPLDFARDAQTISEIKTFMAQLFPVKELHDYMWDHLASTMIGTAGNQTFNMYIGHGQNGKSVLVSLMEMVLGEYKGDVPLSLLTDRRTKIGGLAPELVALKGVRYAVMQEPQKGDRINEGVMKQLTSGVDPIQARAPYMTNVLTFVPQFKLAVCSNEFMEIKTQDHGTWRRIRVVDFMSLFTENPITNDPSKPYQFKLDLELKDTKFAEWKHVFASMLVDRAYETSGKVNDCKMVLASSLAYRERQDYIAEFIADKISEDPAGTITKVELSSEFKLWYESTYGRGGPAQKDVQAYMDKKFKKCNVRKVWLGVKVRYERDVSMSHSSNGGSVVDEDDVGDVMFEEI